MTTVLLIIALAVIAYAWLDRFWAARDAEAKCRYWQSQHDLACEAERQANRRALLYAKQRDEARAKVPARFPKGHPKGGHFAVREAVDAP